MLPLIKFFAVLLLLLLPFSSGAQVDTLLALPTVDVREKLARGQDTGGRTRTWDHKELRAFAHNNLAEWLSGESGLFIKSYGNGSIATTSIRGGSAAHTSVLWNGIPIQSPMLGQLDFSLFPLGFVDRVRISYGGNSAAWGSGAIGGVVHLEQELPADSTLALGFRPTLGNFGFQDYQLQGNYRRGVWGVQTRLFRRTAENDFPYQLGPDQPQKKQNHAAIRQSGLMQSLYWTPTPRQQWGLHLWAQQSDREIPPTTVQNRSLATQADRTLRTALHWKRIGDRAVWQARFGFFHETIDYRDEEIRLRALTAFRTVLGEVTGTWAWNNKGQLQFGFTHNWITAEADAYRSDSQQHRTAPFIVYRYGFGPWQVQFNLRQEIVDGRFQPLVPGLGVERPLGRSFSVSAKISRNYRLPTLNDLYWQPGGNPELLPESGWSEEAGLQWKTVAGKHRWSLGVTVFNRHIRNWILWSRPEGESFWSSNNITRVWSRGLEHRLQWEWQTSDWSVRIAGGYDYIRSTNEVAITNPKLEAGVQLVYVPEHQAFGQIRLRWRSLQWHYRYTYTGSVNSLNVGELAPYRLGYLGINYQAVFPAWETEFFFQVNNLWDEHYRVIERQPMPGRHFRIGLHFTVHNKHPHQ